MRQLRCVVKPLSVVVVLSVLALSLYVPAARAGMIGTANVIGAAQAPSARGRLRALLDRRAVRAALLARGVDPAQVRARVDGLTDRQAQTLAAKMDQLPAGGDIIGAVVFVFLVLLITDILGFTDVFPFVKHPQRR